MTRPFVSRLFEPVVPIVREHSAAPSDARRAVKEVITAMTGDARRAANEAQLQLERLGDTLSVYEGHLFAVVDDFASRITTLRAMYDDIGNRAVVAQKALYAAPLTPPAPPPDLADAQLMIAADQEAPQG